MTRIFCEKHGIKNAYRKWKGKRQDKTFTANCGCRFKNIDDITVHTRYYTEKHGLLTLLSKKAHWVWENK